MASSRRSFVLLSATLALLAGVRAHAEPSQENQLVGKWRHVSSSHALDGRQSPVKPSETNAIGEFTANRRWCLVSSQNRSSGTYRWLDGERLEQTVVESGLPAQVGMISIKRVRISGERLELITTHSKEELERAMPNVKPGERRAREMVVTTVFSKITPE